MHRGALRMHGGVVIAVDGSGHVQAHTEVDGRVLGFDVEADAVGGAKGAVVEFVAVLVGVAGFGKAHFSFLRKRSAASTASV